MKVKQREKVQDNKKIANEKFKQKMIEGAKLACTDWESLVAARKLGIADSPIIHLMAVLEVLMDGEVHKAVDIAEKSGYAAQTINNTLTWISAKPDNPGIILNIGTGSGPRCGYQLPDGKLQWGLLPPRTRKVAALPTSIKRRKPSSD